MNRPVSGVRLRPHQAASKFGRSMACGQSVPCGQLALNQRIERSNVPVVMSRPEAIRSRAPPALKTMVETRAREMPRAAAYASATVRS
jgi:hypothetical protein